MPEEKGMVGRIFDAAKQQLGRMVGESADTIVNRLLPQGRDELTNAIFGNSAYWAGQQPSTVTPEPGVHGPQTEAPQSPEVAPPMAPEMAQALNQEAQREASNNWFALKAEHERGSSGMWTAQQKEARLDAHMAHAAAVTEMSRESGTQPPEWATMTRDQAKEAFTPPESPHMAKARDAADLQDAKAFVARERAIDKAMAGMSEQERQIAASFREVPRAEHGLPDLPKPHPLEAARQRMREITPEKGRELEI